MLRNIRRDPPWLFLALFGSGAAAIALEYNFGAVNNIGAAIYPLILSGTIVLLALYGMVFGQPGPRAELDRRPFRSEEHTSELQSLMRISYAVFCLKKKHNTTPIYVTTYYLSLYITHSCHNHITHH